MTLHVTRTQRLSAVIAISGIFFTAEISVGFYTHSLALIADAFHYLNDLVGFVVALAAIRITKTKDSPKGFSFGWQRAQLLGAFFNGVFLAALGLSIFLQALERFVSLTKVDRPLLVVIVGAIGLTLNIISILFLHDHGHDHGHGSHQIDEHSMPIDTTQALGVHADHVHTSNPASDKPHRDLGMLGVLIHLAGDAMNNVGVIGAGAAIMWGKTEGRFYADPAISMGISFMILATSIPLIKNSGKILLQSSPVDIDIVDVKKDLEKLPGVLSVHELHIWSLSQEKRVASAHIVTEDETLSGFLTRAKLVGECLHAYGVHSYTIQPEPHLFEDNGQSRAVVVNDSVPQLLGGQESSGIELDSLRFRGKDCRLQCEGDACKELQCCD